MFGRFVFAIEEFTGGGGGGCWGLGFFGLLSLSPESLNRRVWDMKGFGLAVLGVFGFRAWACRFEGVGG